MDPELSHRGGGTEKPTAGSPLSPETLSLEVHSLDLSLSGSLEAIVRLAEQIHLGTIVSIVLLDEARQHLRPGAAPNLPDVYNQMIGGSAIGPDANPCGTAAFGNCLVVVEDIQSDPLWAKFKSSAVELGLRACWSQPIRGLAGQVLGVIAFYHPEARLPTGEQIRSIQNLAVTASNVIEKHEARTYTDEIEFRLSQASSRLNEVEEHADDERRSVAKREAFYGKIMEMLPAMVVVKEAITGKFVHINRAAEVATGLSSAEAVGKTVHELFPAEEANRSWDEDQEVILTKQVKVEQGALVTTKDLGERYWTTRKAATFEEGEPTYIVTVGEDVTEQHLLNVALRTALDAAEASGRAKSAFLANMSHELRTPLNGIVAASDILTRKCDRRDQLELLDIIRSSGETLTALLADLLDTAKIEAGELKINNETFDLRELAEFNHEKFKLQNINAGVTYELIVEEGIGGFYSGDPLRIRQVLGNFLSNAAKFTAAGKIVLSVERTSSGLIRFSVSDTGMGFAPEAKGRLFDRFQQADETITRKFGGTGIGLSICRDLVELMDGTLDCESQPGRGSTFWFELPLESVDAPRDTSAIAAAVETPDRPLRVLIADDHPTNRKVAELMLSGMAKVVSVVDGQEAVDAAFASHFDIILMDMQMPVMDGLTAVQRIRASSSTCRDVPIVMMTANAMREHIEASRSAGADVHLAKPITAETLFAAMNEAMERAVPDQQNALHA
ncbi:MAG: ATP-binding protein [Brevundimonas sp.]|uniref:GAF domain-containing hybrid sensor histidine kinase/response regulator n=1 Tax=Brevundimonas sp. TaxID=1871086 RepID=UPI00248870AF|nr:ATP-binding protein [Brevundimonas sp.]MDI1327542.1 ATP-binding protein [Brevundimonas sp.]